MSAVEREKESDKILKYSININATLYLSMCSSTFIVHITNIITELVYIEAKYHIICLQHTVTNKYCVARGTQRRIGPSAYLTRWGKYWRR